MGVPVAFCGVVVLEGVRFCVHSLFELLAELSLFVGVIFLKALFKPPMPVLGESADLSIPFGMGNDVLGGVDLGLFVDAFFEEVVDALPVAGLCPGPEEFYLKAKHATSLLPCPRGISPSAGEQTTAPPSPSPLCPLTNGRIVLEVGALISSSTRGSRSVLTACAALSISSLTVL